MKNKNLSKSGESLRELYFKVDEEAFHITKNKRDIPIVYQTVKDMYIMTNNNPEELYIIEEMIDEEETHLCKDIKRQQKEIDRLIDEKKKEERKSKKKDKKHSVHQSSRQSSLNLSNSLDLKRNNVNEQNDNKRETVFESNKKEEKIYTDAIEISINNTQKFLKDEMINFQKIVNQSTNFTTDNILKQKLEKKEMERILQGQLVNKPDLSFEAEFKEELRIEREKQKEEEIKRRTNSFGKNPLSIGVKKKKQII